MSRIPAIEPAIPARPRGLNLVDAMIWTAAAAMALMPPSGEYLARIPATLRTWNDWLGHLAGWRVLPGFVGVDVGRVLVKSILNFVQGLLINPLIGLTLAAIWYQLRRPRPFSPTLGRQPGFVACVAASLGFLAFIGATFLGVDLSPGIAIGGAIAAAWGVLALGRRWDAERSGIDRLGRVAGVGWIAGTLFELLERSI